eukprot:gene32174-16711_t
MAMISSRTGIQGATKRAGPARSTVCAVAKNQAPNWQSVAFAGAAALTISLSGVAPASAAFRIPTNISTDPARCDRGRVGNTIGQANAVSDVLLDIRQCSYKGEKLIGKVLAGALMGEADFSDTNLQESVLTKAFAAKAYAAKINLDNADLTNATIDRTVFDGASMRGTKFINAVITGASFLDADLTGAVFEDAVIGSQDVKKLCANPTLVGDSRLEVGCRQ